MSVAVSIPAPLDAPGVVDVADTYGWDTVFAIHIADANAAIKAQKTSPQSFSQKDPEDAVSASGRFGDWAIVPGGDGDLICMGLPFHDTQVDGGRHGTWSGLSGMVKVNLRLDLLHDEELEHRRHLKVRTTKVDDNTPIAEIVQVIFDDPKISAMAGTIIEVVMQTWLNDNLQDFDHVFSTVDLDRKADTGDFQWMQPTDVAYAYTDLGSATDGALGILSMTGGRSSKGLIQQLSNKCLPPGKRACLLISKARLTDQLLMHTIAYTFKGANASDFKLSTTGESIVNANSGISFTCKTDDGESRQATIDSLSAGVDAQVLNLDVTTTCELSPGIHAHTHTISRLLMTLDEKSQSLKFADAPGSPVTTHSTDTDEGVKITEEVLALAALIAGIAATVVTGGAAIGAVALAIGFAAGVMAITTTAIQDAGESDAPAITGAVLNASTAIQWPHGSGFVLDGASLNDSLQLTGAYV